MKKRMDKFNIVYWDGGKLSRKEDKKFSNGEILKGYLKWCAYETNYFAIIAVPLQKGCKFWYVRIHCPVLFNNSKLAIQNDP
jgi:hypothetical protein